MRNGPDHDQRLEQQEDSAQRARERRERLGEVDPYRKCEGCHCRLHSAWHITRQYCLMCERRKGIAWHHPRKDLRTD